MLTVNINKEPVNFPTHINDLSLKQFFAIKSSKDIIDEISACTGIERNKIENFKDLKTIQAANALLGTLRMSIEAGFDNKTFPPHIMIGLKKVTVPKELRLEPIGAFMSVNDILAEHTNKMIGDAAKRGQTLNTDEINFTDCIPKVLAHYFFLPYHGDQVLYSDIKAESEEYMQKIMNIPFTQAVPIANFFFLKYPNLI